MISVDGCTKRELLSMMALVLASSACKSKPEQGTGEQAVGRPQLDGAGSIGPDDMSVIVDLLVLLQPKLNGVEPDRGALRTAVADMPVEVQDSILAGLNWMRKLSRHTAGQADEHASYLQAVRAASHEHIDWKSLDAEGVGARMYARLRRISFEQFYSQRVVWDALGFGGPLAR